MNPLIKIYLLIFIFALSTGINAQVAGSLDTSFGSGGTLTTHLNVAAMNLDMAIQPDKKIVVAGSTFESMGIATMGMVARFNENGTLDTTFNGNGYVLFDIMREVRSVKILPNGKILIAGLGSVGNGRFAVARLNSNGSMDSTFNGSGSAITTLGFSSGSNCVIPLPDNKILAIGLTQLVSGGNYDFGIIKYNADGSLDTDFGTGGRIASDVFGSDERAVSCAFQPDGKFLISGYYTDILSNQQLGLLVRYNADGTIDNSFGNNGKITNPGFGQVSISNIAIQSDGKIITAGDRFIPVRYNSNGTIDLQFSSLGNGTSGVALQPNGKIIFAFNFNLYRFDSNGTVDTTFGTNGVAISTHAGNSVKLTPDGKIVYGGTRLNNNFEIIISRFLNNRTGSFDFDGDSKTDVSIFRPSNGEWWFLRSSDGGNYALQFGISTDKIVPADYTGDGKTDVAVYRPSGGEWYILRSEDFSFYAFPFGNSTDIPSPADFDGDGKADPTVFRESTGTWFIYKSTGGIQISNFGTVGDIPLAADFDGDLKADLTIFRASHEYWYQRSSDGQVGGFYMFWATAQRFRVQGDYDGNGTTDIALYNGAGRWLIRHTGSSTPFAVDFGMSGDIAVPGDYNGDGVFDLAVFRPSNGTWYIRNSSGGETQFAFGTNGDIPTANAFVR